MHKLIILPVLFAACATTGADDESTDDSALTGPTRHLACTLQYETFSPTFATQLAATFDEKYTVVKKSGASATDGAFTLSAIHNATPPFNLVDTMVITNAQTGGTVAYVVLPSPHLGGDFLFELGGKIDPVTPAGSTVAFDFMRGFCSLVLE